MEKLTIKDFREMTIKIAEDIQENKDYLCEVDAAIGDGDHGISMAKGFKEAEKRLRDKTESDFESVGDVFKVVGMSLLDKIGGATGPIFSTIFLSGAKIAKSSESADLSLLAEMFSQAVADVCKRGNSKPGDKTLIDALNPAAEALKEAAEAELSIEKAIDAAYQAAEDGLEATKDMAPKQGKSRYLKDRAIGHQDAGATSITIIFRAMKDYLGS